MNRNKFFTFFLFCVLLLSHTGCTHMESQKGPESTESLLKIADRMRLEGNEKTAHSFYAQILEKDPKHKETHIALGKMLRKNKEYESALKQLQIALLHHPDAKDVKGEVVKTYIALNQGHMAALETHNLIKHDPKNPAFHNLLGVALDLQEKHLEAQASYSQSLELQPDQLRVQSNLGLSLALSGQYPEAISLLERVVHSESTTPKDRHNLAVAYGMSGDLDKAESIFRIDLSADAAQENSRYLAALKKIKKQSVKKTDIVHSQDSTDKSPKELYVQAGTYSSKKKAFRGLKKIKKIVRLPSSVEPFKTIKGTQIHHVLVGPVDNEQKGQEVLKIIEAEGFEGGFLVSLKK